MLPSSPTYSEFKLAPIEARHRNIVDNIVLNFISQFKDSHSCSHNIQVLFPTSKLEDVYVTDLDYFVWRYKGVYNLIDQTEVACVPLIYLEVQVVLTDSAINLNESYMDLSYLHYMQNTTRTSQFLDELM